MLNFYDRPFVYFPPEPNKLIIRLGRIYNTHIYLPGPEHRVKPVHCEGCDLVRKLAADKSKRLIFVANHPTHSDSQVMTEAFRQSGVWSKFMATYDLFFRQSKFNRWVMQKAGTFSVDREGFNSEPIKEAVNTLLEGKYHLTIFSEGRPYLQNDLVTPFQGGGAFIAVSAQKALDADGQDAQVLIVPTAIKLSHSLDCRAKIRDMLGEIFDYLDTEAKPNEPIETQIEDAALKLMDHSLLFMGYPPSVGKNAEERQQYSADMIIQSLESEMQLQAAPGDSLMKRARAIRTKIHRIMLALNGDSRLWAVSRVRAQKVMLAMKILSYPTNYVKYKPTLDRCGETVERLLEDKQYKAIPPYNKRAALVKFGQAFGLDDIDPGKTMKRGELFTSVAARSQTAVQDMLDEINENNPYPGGELFSDQALCALKSSVAAGQ